jgi:hypothetical protein
VRTGLRTSAVRTAGMVSKTPFSVETKVETAAAGRCRFCNNRRIGLSGFGVICGLTARKLFRNSPLVMEPIPCGARLPADSTVQKPRGKSRTNSRKNPALSVPPRARVRTGRKINEEPAESSSGQTRLDCPRPVLHAHHGRGLLARSGTVDDADA